MSIQIPEDIIIALEEADALWPEIEGKLRYLSMENATGCITPYDTYFMNRICMAKLSDTDAVAEIEKIKAIYAKENKPYAWVVGPNSRPHNLRELLIDAGFKPAGQTHGMFKTDLDVPGEINPDIEVRELTSGNYDTAIKVMAAGNEIDISMARDYYEMIQIVGDRVRCRTYLAYDKKTNQAVGNGELTYIPGKPIVLLGGASTLPGFRKLGVYHALLKKRLAEAKADGIEAVMISAMADTSAPICDKFGFTKVCEMSFFKYELT